MIIAQNKIGILGIGAWATAIANLLSDNGYQVLVWSHELDLIDEINTNRINNKYLPNFRLNPSIIFTPNLYKLLDCSIIVLAIPTQYIRQTLQKYEFDFNNKIIVNVAKGIEKHTLLRVSQIISDTINTTNYKYVVVTGPSHAEEVARRVPTAVVSASENADISSLIQKIFSNNYFRVYTSSDVIGCELGGALKNVIAIAAGIIDGLKLGDNPKAALITRGLAEISRLGQSLGANPLTFSGLSGLGDLIVTCNSRYSRNRYVGEEIGKGRKMNEIIRTMNAVAEGVDTAVSGYHLGKKLNVELPIIEKVYQILFEDLEPQKALEELMLRQTKPEWWW
jgi:glycerol-3-phosphate dehydrogenase (NAD(P)+)